MAKGCCWNGTAHVAPYGGGCFFLNRASATPAPAQVSFRVVQESQAAVPGTAGTADAAPCYRCVSMLGEAGGGTSVAVCAVGGVLTVNATDVPVYLLRTSRP